MDGWGLTTDSCSTYTTDDNKPFYVILVCKLENAKVADFQRPPREYISYHI